MFMRVVNNKNGDAIFQLHEGAEGDTESKPVLSLDVKSGELVCDTIDQITKFVLDNGGTIPAWLLLRIEPL